MQTHRWFLVYDSQVTIGIRTRQADTLALLAALLLAGSACAQFGQINAVPGPNQKSRWREGRPVLEFHGSKCDAVIEPFTTSGGRYEVEDRVRFHVLVRNRNASEIDISETSFAVTANGRRVGVVAPGALEQDAAQVFAYDQGTKTTTTKDATKEEALTLRRSLAPVRRTTA